jgi:hypothetical protein
MPPRSMLRNRTPICCLAMNNSARCFPGGSVIRFNRCISSNARPSHLPVGVFMIDNRQRSRHSATSNDESADNKSLQASGLTLSGCSLRSFGCSTFFLRRLNFVVIKTGTQPRIAPQIPQTPIHRSKPTLPIRQSSPWVQHSLVTVSVFGLAKRNTKCQSSAQLPPPTRPFQWRLSLPTKGTVPCLATIGSFLHTVATPLSGHCRLLRCQFCSLVDWPRQPARHLPSGPAIELSAPWLHIGSTHGYMVCLLT